VRDLVRGRQGRIGLVVLGLAIVVVAAFLATRTSGAPPVGPLSTTNLNVIADREPVSASDTVTWGAFMPTNPTSEPISITSVEPVDPSGVEIVQIEVNDPATEGAIGTVRAFPPPGVTMHPIAGAILQPLGSKSPYLQILVGVRLRSGAVSGSIGGLRVTYVAGGESYQLVLPDSLKLEQSPASSSA
jgi:hypothetical protein